MTVPQLNVSQQQACAALREYRQHRDTYDKRDWEIERIYRAIAKGNKVISINQSIRNAGVDELQRPRLAICSADASLCRCDVNGSAVDFKPADQKQFGPPRGVISISWSNFPIHRWWRLQARLPRIPPQHRPASGNLAEYHLLWEADWEEIPRDPMLLRRIGKDAWVVLAAWDLTDVEMNVLRAHSHA